MDLHYSQTLHLLFFLQFRFTTLWIYTILKRWVQTVYIVHSFTTLWIYTILKRYCEWESRRTCFTTLWIYTILKQTGDEDLLWIVSLPYGFTLFSNWSNADGVRRQFHYLMDLHYSQTSRTQNATFIRFTTLWIYTILKLVAALAPVLAVSLPYGFTLFSNNHVSTPIAGTVSLPYGFTLFSNVFLAHMQLTMVSLPYGFTLFSNAECFKLVIEYSFTTLWIYTILKRYYNFRIAVSVSLPYGFTLFSNNVTTSV